MTTSSGSSRFFSRRLAWLAAATLVLLLTGFLAAVLVWQFFGGGVWRSEVNVVEAPRRLALLIVAAVALLLTGFLTAVSAWQYFGGGVWRSEVSVAEAPRRLARLVVAAVALLLAGLLAAVLVWQLFGGGVWRSEVSVAEAELRSPQRLVLTVNSCNGDPEVSLLRETDVDVQVKVVASSTPFRGGCDGQDSVEVRLQEPLGGRVVVDKHTGQRVTTRRQ
ncbi:MAG: hypothetical protein L0177_01430 [Chloroflexi bacterium]|nr:hypothetical protein [Chloroflexota bacterium]